MIKTVLPNHWLASNRICNENILSEPARCARFFLFQFGKYLDTPFEFFKYCIQKIRRIFTQLVFHIPFYLQMSVKNNTFS